MELNKKCLQRKDKPGMTWCGSIIGPHDDFAMIAGASNCDKCLGNNKDNKKLEFPKTKAIIKKIDKVMENIVHKHRESDIKVYHTTNYNAFKIIKGNRKLNQNKIIRIKDAINGSLDMLRFCPIIVDSEMNVIDGQHRLQICKDMKRPVYYVISTYKVTLRNVARLNANTEKWKTIDYITCWIQNGDQGYVKAKEIVEDSGIGYAVILGLLHNGNASTYKDTVEDDSKKSQHQLVKDGILKISHLTYTELLIDEFKKVRNHCDGAGNRSLISAIERLIEYGEYKSDVMIKKIEDSNMRIEARSSPKDYLKQIEEIYNFRNSKRVILH